MRCDETHQPTAAREERAPKEPKRFIPPTLEEVRAYCLERNNSVNAEQWLDHYTSNGWKVGKNAMKDWKAAVRTWEKNDFKGTTNGQKQGADLYGSLKRFVEAGENDEPG